MSPRPWLTGLLLLAVLAVARADPPTEAEFAEQIRRLDPKAADPAERLKAATWISSNSRIAQAATAIPALERCVRDDPAWEVRQKAVLALGVVAKGLGRPCPLPVLEAIHDPEQFVRYQAFERASQFKDFPPGARDVVLRGVVAENAELRGSSLILLPRVAAKDPKALDAIELAKKDKVFDVRHSAHVARFLVRDRLDEFLPYLIRVREDPASVLSPVAEDSEVGKNELRERNLILLGTASRMVEWGESRTDELAAALVKLLADESPVLRRGAAGLIGASAVKVEPLPQGGGLEAILPYIDPPAAPKAAAPEKSKVAARLESLGVVAALQKLRADDADRSVRDAARSALERLATVQVK